MKRAILLILSAALLLTMLPASALAEKSSIYLGGKVGFMYEDSSVTLKPKLKNIISSQLSWSSSDSSVASVSGGRITAHKAGRAVVSVSGGNAKASCGVVVLPREVSVQVGETVSLPNGTVESYAMQDTSVARIKDNGVIGGISAGSTYVKVKYGSQKLNVKVNVIGGGTVEQSKAAFLACADSTSQIVLVEYEGGSNATLSIHEKNNGVWKELYSCGAYVGRNGIGKTKEGDKKTPIGTYNLTTPFGIKSDPGANMDYTKVTKYHYWCGTSGSKYYNRLIDTREIDRSCTSSDEYLIRYEGEYNYCMFIDYNAAGAAGKGSCIFLHCKGDNKYTAGCIAVSESVMKKIIQWAEPGAKIVIC